MKKFLFLTIFAVALAACEKQVKPIDNSEFPVKTFESLELLQQYYPNFPVGIHYHSVDSIAVLRNKKCKINLRFDFDFEETEVLFYNSGGMHLFVIIIVNSNQSTIACTYSNFIINQTHIEISNTHFLYDTINPIPTNKPEYYKRNDTLFIDTIPFVEGNTYINLN
jgi:hypothetical protein